MVGDDHRQWQREDHEERHPTESDRCNGKGEKHQELTGSLADTVCEAGSGSGHAVDEEEDDRGSDVMEVGSEQEKKTAVVDTVEVEGFQFPAQITPSAKPLSLLGHGVTDIEIHFLQIKFNAVGIYLDRDGVLEHLRKTNQLKVEDDGDAFFDAVVAAPAEKLLRVVVIKEIKGSQYGVQLESSVRDRLVAAERYDDDEEEALDKVSEFFQSKYFRPGSVVTFHFPAAGTVAAAAEISFATEGKDEARVAVENAAVAEMIQRWYLGGNSAVSQTAVRSLADHFSALLSLSP